MCAPSNVAVDNIVERLCPSALAKMSVAGAKAHTSHTSHTSYKQGNNKHTDENGNRDGKYAEIDIDTNTNTDIGINIGIDVDTRNSTYTNSTNSSSTNSKDRYVPPPQPRLVRLGNPARIGPKTQPHCLDVSWSYGAIEIEEGVMEL